MTETSNVVKNIYQKYGYNDTSVSTTSTTKTTATTSTTSTTSTTQTTSKTDYTDTSLKRYLDSTSSEKVDAKTVFNKLSIDVGGDGKTISKDDLDSYIKEANSGKVKISKEELSGLKELQSDWGEIAGKQSSITYNNVVAAGHKDTLTSMAPEAQNNTVDVSSMTASSMANINDYLTQSALSFSPNSSPKANYSSMLNTLLTGTTDVNDEANADMIAKLTDLIARTQKISTIDKEA